jgi:hypothetical protein
MHVKCSESRRRLLVIGGNGNNSLAPAMPLVMERKRYFVGLT